MHESVAVLGLSCSALFPSDWLIGVQSFSGLQIKSESSDFTFNNLRNNRLLLDNDPVQDVGISLTSQ